MRRTQIFALTIGAMGLFGTSTPAFATGCGYTVPVAMCGPQLAAPMMRPAPVMQPVPYASPVPVPMPIAVPQAVPIPPKQVTVNFKQPMDHLRSVTYTQTPEINLTKVYSTHPSADSLVSDLPTGPQQAPPMQIYQPVPVPMAPMMAAPAYAQTASMSAMPAQRPAPTNDYWEQVSGPTMLGSTPASQIICRRQGAPVTTPQQPVCQPQQMGGGFMVPQSLYGQGMHQFGAQMGGGDWTR